MDTKEFLTGKATDGHTFFGPHKKDKGYIFRLLAPNAKEVAIMGDFTDWQPHKMRGYSTGVYSLTEKTAKAGDRYQYIITDEYDNVVKKIDPFARNILVEENCAVVSESTYMFKNKKITDKAHNIYEVHLGSLLKSGEGFEKITANLIDHAIANNFSHLNLMPVTEYKNYKTMGYPALGHFALSNRYGEIDLFKEFIDKAHGKGLGVIIDLDLAEFDPDGYYLRNFDGTSLYDYDYEDVRYNYYGSMNFDPSKHIVASFLKSVISYWIDDFNVDGINLTSIDNMIYWQGDKDRGVNKEWINLLRDLVDLVHDKKTLALASFNGIYGYDLGFDRVFDEAMRPIVRILQREPVNRDNYKADVYKLIGADNREKILGFNHIDSYLNEARIAMKMYGDWAKLSQLKSLYTLTYTLNSAKLVFMGDEVSDYKTWSVYEPVNLDELDEVGTSFNTYFKDLSILFLDHEAIYMKESDTQILDIGGYSIYAYIREYGDERLLVIINLTDIDYNIKAPYNLSEILSTEDLAYGGSGNLNGEVNKNEQIKIAPFGASVLKIKG